jgi:peptide subunit release factor 1 (eRF1)
LRIPAGMEKTTTALATPLREQLDRLAAVEPTEWPVLSLYLDMRPDQHGRDNYDTFLRKTFLDRIRTFKGEARKSFERDADRIRQYLADLPRSTTGLAVFACAACGNFFEAIQLDAPVDQHWLFIGSVPHLYPLAKLNDQYPRYAAVLLDTNSARLFVFGLGTAEKTQQVANTKTRKTSMGGWSQSRYQRRAENFHLQHMKEVVGELDRLVREEQLTRIVVACDQVAKPIFMEQLPRHLADKLVDVMALDIRAPEHQVLSETLEALRQADAQTDAEHVEAMLGAWRAGGLGVVGPEDTLKALSMRQVEELLITASPDLLRRVKTLPEGTAPGPVEVDTSAPRPRMDADRLKLADELVTKAQQNSARIRFIEDPTLLDDVGGVGALLRFKI